LHKVLKYCDQIVRLWFQFQAKGIEHGPGTILVGKFRRFVVACGKELAQMIIVKIPERLGV